MRHLLLLVLCACAGAPEGLLPTPLGDGPLVRVDWDAHPLPDVPFPNDLATTPDPTSPTGLRPNLPLTADIELEQETRRRVNGLVGFGIFAPISVAFEGRLDLDALLAHHPPLAAYDAESWADDAILVLDVTPGSPTYLEPVPLDLGSQRFPTDATQLGTFLANDPRADQPHLLWETGEEDLDADGILDPGEDTDNDGILDHPNVWPPGGDPRTDVLTFYDLQTDTLQVRPVTPLREETTYAVVLTRDLVDAAGNPVRSPWEYVNHLRQTAALGPVVPALERLGRPLEDVVFAWTFTTGSVTRDLWDLAEGVRGRGPFASLAADYPAGVTEGHHMWTPVAGVEPLVLPLETVFAPLTELGLLPYSSLSYLEDAYPAFTDGIVGGAFVAADLLFDRDDGGRDDSDESWEVDASTGYVAAAPRRIAFTCILPRAVDGRGPPWDVDIHMHGYGSTRVEQVAFAYALNRNGIAVCGIDAVGHGLDLPPADLDAVAALVELAGATPLLHHLQDDRLRDLDNDGLDDGAGDAFSADPFHSRDMFRQPVLDVAQLIESLKQCGNGEMEEVIPTAVGPLRQNRMRVSCDWDGDGAPDIGGPDANFTLEGVSMGGIMSSLGAAVQDISAAVVTVPGGGLADVAPRSDISEVSDGMVGRALTPLIIGTPVVGGIAIEQLVVSVDHTVRVHVATVPTPPPGSTITVRNLDLGTEETGWIPDDGRLRVPIGANALDAAEKAIAAGIPVGGVVEGETYEIADNAGLGDRLQIEVRDPSGAVLATIDQFEERVVEEGVTMRAGSPLVAASWGLGLRRGSSDLRRTLNVLAMAIEPADPIAYARRWATEPFDDEPTPVLVHLTVGDTTVPISTGISLARAANLIRTDRVDARYGTTVDRWLVDRAVVRGMEEFGPWTTPGGRSILFDPDDLDHGADDSAAPSDTPLRANLRVDDAQLALRFLYVSDTGSHAYYFPDEARPFDFDLFGAQQMGWFLASGGEVSDDVCLAGRDCAFLPPIPDIP